MNPKRGLIFQHRYFLDSIEWGMRKALNCKVTKVAQGVVYYRPLYGLHDDGTEWLGAPSYIPIDKFETIVHQG